MTGAVGVAGDFDYYSVVVPADGTLFAQIGDGGTGDCAAFVIDSELTLYDTDGTTQLGFNEDFGSDYCSSLVVSGLPAGTYYLRAASSQYWAPNDTFNYELMVAVQ